MSGNRHLGFESRSLRFKNAFDKATENWFVEGIFLLPPRRLTQNAAPRSGKSDRPLTQAKSRFATRWVVGIGCRSGFWFFRVFDSPALADSNQKNKSRVG